MRYLEYVREAFDALMRNKTRSLLTLLGMVIGVAAVDAVYGLSVGAAQAINAAFLSGSDPSLVVYVDPKQADPDAARMNYRDAELVAANGGARSRASPPSTASFYLARAAVTSTSVTAIRRSQPSRFPGTLTTPGSSSWPEAVLPMTR